MAILETVRDHSHIYKDDDEFRRAHWIAKRLKPSLAAALMAHMDGPQPVVIRQPHSTIRRGLEQRGVITTGTARRPQQSSITKFGRRVVALLIERELLQDARRNP